MKSACFCSVLLLYLFIGKIKVLESNNGHATNKQIKRFDLHSIIFLMLFLMRYQAQNLSEKPLSCTCYVLAKSEYTNAFFFTILQKTLDIEPLCVNSHVAEEVNGNFEIVLKEDSKTTRGHDVFSMRGIFFFSRCGIQFYSAAGIFLFHTWKKH